LVTAALVDDVDPDDGVDVEDRLRRWLPRPWFPNGNGKLVDTGFMALLDAFSMSWPT
jgi:hypothetical protein